MRPMTIGLSIALFNLTTIAFAANEKMSCRASVDGVGHYAEIELAEEADLQMLRIDIFSGFENSTQHHCEGEVKPLKDGKGVKYLLTCDDSNADAAIQDNYRLHKKRGKWTFVREMTLFGSDFDFEYTCGSSRQ
jgi:hypothetical protein